MDAVMGPAAQIQATAAAVAQNITAATTTVAQNITVATTTVATVAITTARSGQRNGTHRPVNVHGRLMYDDIVINDVWINVILSTLALTSAACLCMCFLYCKYQQWKNSVQQRRNEKNSQTYDNDSLPSYTIVTGLPTYDEAIERMKPAVAAAAAAAADAAATAATSAAAATTSAVTTAAASASFKPPSISVVYVRAEVAKPEPKFGLVSHRLLTHSDFGHRLSVQELLETYDV